MVRFTVSQNLIDDEIPCQATERLSVDSNERDDFTVGINFQNLALVSVA